jgi:hypothetical protein
VQRKRDKSLGPKGFPGTAILFANLVNHCTSPCFL